MQLARNIGILALVALAVTVLPGGNTATSTVLGALTMAFLASLAWFVWVSHRENQMTIDALTDGWRALLYGAIGLLVFLVAGADEMFATGAGTLAWIGLFGLSIFALLRVFQESRAY